LVEDVIGEALNGVREAEGKPQERRGIHGMDNGRLVQAALGRQVSPGLDENEKGLGGGTMAARWGRRN
jgi:hypothetical protein